MAEESNPEEYGSVLASPNEGRELIIKFTKEARPRLVENAFSSASHQDLTPVNDCVLRHAGCQVSRLFDQTEDRLEADVATLASRSRIELGPLNVYYYLATRDSAEADSLVKELQDDPNVEEAYPIKKLVPAVFVEPAQILPEEARIATTEDFRSQQGYLNPSPEGVDAEFAWTLAGGRGDKVKIVDVEGAWNFSHEDLLQNQGGVIGGSSTALISWENHGTAVQGEIAGDVNQTGVVGIAPDSRFSGVSVFGDGNSSAKAIKLAADKLDAGDVLLIELHGAGPNANGQGQFGYVPMEFWSADFDAIKYATAKGIIVIEAAGNGFQNLDDEVDYAKKFNRQERDSGAILVGAGAPPSGVFGPDRSRLPFSNYGSIVDVQGWGREVTTTGYGDLQGGTDRNRVYTRTFSGTSSASPIIVGVAACLQSIQITRGGAPLTPSKMREILRSTGVPQTAAPNRGIEQRIGNRPDLKAAMSHITPEVSTGHATRYWDEILTYPEGNPPKLWLQVNGAWKQLVNPNQSTRDMVQRAFLGKGSTVRVWYTGSTVVALVVDGS